MAFPIPAHLPRKKDLDVSTTILSKMSETPLKSLSHELASGWVSELDMSIRQTKERIHERVQADLPSFERQLASSLSVQERLQSLRSNVDRLQDALSHPKTGLVPALIATLTRHASLAQEAEDAGTLNDAMSYLATCKREMRILTDLVEGGMLPEAVERYERAGQLLDQRQQALLGTEVYVDLQRKIRATNDRAHEQLNEAYSRSVILSASEIIIRPSVQVRASETVLELPSVLKSLSSTNLANLMSTLRRDLTSYYIDYLLGQAATVELSTITSITGTMEYKLSVFPAPRESELLKTRVDNVMTVLKFLNEHLFPHIPLKAAFPISLSRPLTHALLEKLLKPSLPSSQEELPSFLELLRHTVEFEGQYVRGVLGDESGGRDVEIWADSVGSHYEKKRRIQLLERARAIIIRNEDGSSSFLAELPIVREQPETVERLETSSTAATSTSSADDSNWGFDDEDIPDEDGWGLDDELDAEVDQPVADPAEHPAKGASPLQRESPERPVVEESEDDPWGLGDEDDAAAPEDGDASTDSSAWDDPWGDTDQPTPAPKVTKTATRLEKLSNKGKPKDSSSTSAVQSPVPRVPSSSKPATPALEPNPRRPTPPELQAHAETESYLVSGRAKELIWLVEDTHREASELSSSHILASYQHTTTSPVGSHISQTSTFILDLYRGLYPVIAAMKTASPKWAMGLSNDCFWLHEQLTNLCSRNALNIDTKSKLTASRERLRLLSECVYDETIARQVDKIQNLLDGAGSFVRTMDQERFDECEEAVNQVLKDIRTFAQQTKPILTKTKYYKAVGAVVNAALARILQDVLGLPDITEEESHKLNELCRILNALEGLFVEDVNHPSFVVAFVPLWLKFSYLSELLEASIADISYLFEEGALVDFEIDELVNLVRALFADTPLRANTINKFTQGHPAPP